MPNAARITRSARLLVATLFLGQAALFSSIAQAQGGPIRVEWLGCSFYRFTSPIGKVILTNPFITGNPDAAVKPDRCASRFTSSRSSAPMHSLGRSRVAPEGSPALRAEPT